MGSEMCIRDRMNRDAGWLWLGSRLFLDTAEGTPRVSVVHDLDLHPAASEGMGESANVPAVAAEVERRIERRHHRDTQRRRGARHGQPGCEPAGPVARPSGRQGRNEAGARGGTARMLSQARAVGEASAPDRGVRNARALGSDLLAVSYTHLTLPTNREV